MPNSENVWIKHHHGRSKTLPVEKMCWRLSKLYTSFIWTDACDEYLLQFEVKQVQVTGMVYPTRRT